MYFAGSQRGVFSLNIFNPIFPELVDLREKGSTVKNDLICFQKEERHEANNKISESPPNVLFLCL